MAKRINYEKKFQRDRINSQGFIDVEMENISEFSDSGIRSTPLPPTKKRSKKLAKHNSNKSGAKTTSSKGLIRAKKNTSSEKKQKREFIVERRETKTSPMRPVLKLKEVNKWDNHTDKQGKETGASRWDSCYCPIYSNRFLGELIFRAGRGDTEAKGLLDFISESSAKQKARIKRLKSHLRK